jgi:uncharacterized phage protein (TIGR02218 family)
VRRDGQIFGFTESDHEFDVDGVTYTPGFDLSELALSAGLAVDNMQVTFVPEAPGDALIGVDLLAGLWSGATFTIFECNHLAPTDGVNVLRRGTTGEATLTATGYVLELRSLKQTLQQQLGEVTSKTCKYIFGSTAKPQGLCTIDIATRTFTYTVTAVASRREFTCSAAVEADDFYKEGIARSTDALNDGYEQKIKAFSGGVVTLALPMPFEVQVGDTFDLVEGCQKRREDCVAKSNILNFGGEPDVPGPDALTGDPEGSS